jgi:hypothetical protein
MRAQAGKSSAQLPIARRRGARLLALQPEMIASSVRFSPVLSSQVIDTGSPGFPPLKRK